MAVYFSFGASIFTGVATVFLQKDLGLTPAEVASVGFWLGLPWASKLVLGIASDQCPLFGSRRTAYLVLGVFCTLLGYGLMATVAAATKAQYLSAMLLVIICYIIQYIIDDALSVELALDDEELGQIQALGRMVLLAGWISVAFFGGIGVTYLGARAVFGMAMALPVLVLATLPILRRTSRRPAPRHQRWHPIAIGRLSPPVGTGW